MSKKNFFQRITDAETSQDFSLLKLDSPLDRVTTIAVIEGVFWQ